MSGYGMADSAINVWLAEDCSCEDGVGEYVVKADVDAGDDGDERASECAALDDGVVREVSGSCCVDAAPAEYSE